METVMRKSGLRWAQALLFLLAVAGSGRALAQGAAERAETAEEKDDPAEVTQGSAYVSLPTEFAIPYKDGERYEEHEFERDGKVLVLPALDRTATHEFELRPMTDKFGPATIEIAPKCWKLTKVSKELKVWRCDLTAKFPKGTPGTPPPPPKEPEPEEDPDIPPMPGVPPPPPDFPQ